VFEACAAAKISPEEVTAFGDDLADIPMLRACGLGVAMGNAVKEVKQAADFVIGSNDEEGIAKYLEENFPDITV
ncbi:MAG: HAD hydrolase family protein, partial [Oscillospiraceae bacterium]|nr:HAD hydrolase family protein [Oscillospiraceae bacterium]